MPQSKLERAFLTWWRLLAPDAPAPMEEYRFARVEVGDTPHPPARPGLRKRLKSVGLGDYAFDFCFPDSKLAVECDGGQWAPHGGRHNTDGDRTKLNQAAALGWRVMRFSGQMLRDDPAGIVEMVREAL